MRVIVLRILGFCRVRYGSAGKLVAGPGTAEHDGPARRVRTTHGRQGESGRPVRLSCVDAVPAPGTYGRRSPVDMEMNDAVRHTALAHLNTILETELAGVVRYTHYALMVYGYHRIPIVSWLKSNATEGLDHAHRAGELITLLGGHPSLKIGPLLETTQHDIGDILRESLEHERASLAAYYALLQAVEGRSVLLEDYAREMIANEELHRDEVNKMLRRPGETAPYQE